MKEVYVLYESFRAESEVVAVTLTETSAKKWIQERFEYKLKTFNVIGPDETVDFDLLPQGWVLPHGYSYDDYTCFYEEIKVI
jgi:hypothetical protein